MHASLHRHPGAAPTRAIARAAAAFALVAGIACLSPVDPQGAPVAGVRLVFDGGATTDTIGVRGATRAEASAITRDGAVLPGRAFAFSSSDTSIAVVSELGIVRGRRAGRVTVRATLAGGRYADADVVVVPTTIAYTIPVGSSPRALSFSPDQTRLFLLTARDSLVTVDALGFFRQRTVGLGLAADALAASGDAVYVTHLASDSLSIVSTATNERRTRLFVGAGPAGVAAGGGRAYVATRFDRRIVIVESDRVTLGIPVNGEPVDLALARDGRRLFATVLRGGAWRLLAIAPAFPDTLMSLPLSSAPSALATDASGEHVFVLLGGEGRLVTFAEQADGRYRETGSITVGTGGTGVSARLAGTPLVIVTGDPLAIVDRTSGTVAERVTGVGSGSAAIRPDGVFVFVAASDGTVIRVVGL